MAKTDTPRTPERADDQRDAEGTGDPAVNAYIGKGVACNGRLIYDGTIRIDGTMEGEIHTAGSLWVGEGAVLTAQVHVGRLICQGTITGDITATDGILLRAPAVLNGSITAPSLVMEEGVLLNGTVTMPAQNVYDFVEYQASAARTESRVGAPVLA